MLPRVKLGTKFTLILLIVFIGGTLLSFAALSQALQQRAQDEVASKGSILIGLMNSVRSYTSVNIAPLLGPLMDPQQKFIPETVPAFSAREVFENLRKTPDYDHFLYKEATLDPTNPRDQADPFETALVNRFRVEPDTHELSGYRILDGENTFFSARPFIITKETCLGCHSTPDKAPRSMVAAYGSDRGFGWKLNDVVGTQIIYVPASKVLDTAQRSLAVVLAVFIGIFALVIVLINFLLRRNVVRPIELMARIARKVSAGELNFSAQELEKMSVVAARSDELGESARVFSDMAHQVAARENDLKQQVQQLRIEVDEIRKTRQVAEITETEYFQELKRRAQLLRAVRT